MQADKPGHAISPLLWGIFFEDINLAADGGLYPELIRNRSFEGSDALRFWKFTSAAGTGAEPSRSIDESRPLNAFNRRSLHVRPGGAGCVLENEGYWGMRFVAGETCTFRVAARTGDGFNGALRVQLCDSTGAVIASGELSGFGPGWKQHSLALTPSKSDPRGQLKLHVPGDASGKGSLFLDMISLMPVKTWKGHGLREDLAEAMSSLKPAFFRFPGGCWVEGEDIAGAYRWKETIGDVASRTQLENLWDYNATQGLGYHEYLQLSEDLGAEPVFCINVGMAHHESVPLDRMGAWVQDALDAIEYATGPADSVWGSLRAKNGHPAPFNLRIVEIGNENGGADYAARWPLFVKAIKARYPEITLIANHWQNGYPKEPMPEVVDEHYYDTPEGFMRRATHYDGYDRKGPKIFVGEYAATKRAGLGNLRAAIGEAAFMTGLERNADIVTMAAYAPLFTNVNHRAWNPDLINFDSAGWYGIPGYHVQQLFSLNAGDVTLPIDVQSAELPQENPRGRIGLGTWNTQAEFKDLKVTAPDGKVLFAADFAGRGTEGWTFLGGGEWSVKDGVLRQTSEKQKLRALVGDPAWTDYTIELKARKLAGREGFLVLFHNESDEDRTAWNLGGWGNKYYALVLADSDERKEGSIETGHWYDVRVQLDGDRVRGWLDGKLVHDFRRPHLTTKAIYASATRDKDTGEIILKVVNTAAGPTETTIHLAGITAISGQAQATVLTSEKPTDENSLAEPRKVAPRTEEVTIPGPRFTRSFPGNSLTVLRIPVGK
ncbi:MAG: Extracellular exo-alpha-L-arabinofuranosidase precursor [Rariglobus sp.]|nr:Extracellular exo-alpha-L-arabinofuranosidase precursor [Rariglobus sp.]